MRGEYLIEAYFANQISRDEWQELEDLLRKDEKLWSEFNLQLELREAIRQKHHRELKDRFQRLDLKPGNDNTFRWFLAAASIIILLGLTWYFGMISNQADSDSLYSAHFEIYPNVVAPLERSETSESNQLTREAFGFYANGDFEEAYGSFQKLQENEENEYAVFYAGVSLMADGKYDKAIAEFESKDVWQNNDFNVAANWYLALAHLKKDDKKAALQYLEKVKNADHSYSHEAGKLIKELSAD